MTEGSPLTTLYLIRHGQAVVNVEPIIGGMKGDRGLTALGIAQAERLRDRLHASGAICPDVFVASTLPRARQTAEILAPAFPSVPLQFDDDLHELRPGPEGDGLSLDEYRRRFGWVDFAADPGHVVDPGGESWKTFVGRVCRTLARITTDYVGKTIVAVAHGGVIDASFVYFFGLDRQQLPDVAFATQNTSLTHWEHCLVQGKSRWRLVAYNDAAHLSGMDEKARKGIDYTAVTPIAPGASTKPAAPAVPTEE